MTAGLAVAGMRCGNCHAPFISTRAGQKYCSRVCRQRAHYLDGNWRQQSEPGAVPLYDVVKGQGAVSLPVEAATRVSDGCARDTEREITVQEECSLALAPASAHDGCDDEVDGGHVEPDRPRPAALGPVAHRGRMVRREGERRAGYQPENHEWRGWLCDTELASSWRDPATNAVREVSQFVGKDPMAIPLDILTAAGHPYPRQRGVDDVVSRLKIMQGVDGHKEAAGMGLPFPVPTRYTNVRDYCIECSSGNKAEVRRCPIYDCPAWAFRMGRNPHNPQRGKNPFAGG